MPIEILTQAVFRARQSTEDCSLPATTVRLSLGVGTKCVRGLVCVRLGAPQASRHAQ